MDGEARACRHVAGLGREPGLADARLADQQEDTTPTGGHVVQGGAQLSELAFAPEEDGPTHLLGPR
jgi:hypothetical protein